jgi:hypothetical protein
MSPKFFPTTNAKIGLHLGMATGDTFQSRTRYLLRSNGQRNSDVSGVPITYPHFGDLGQVLRCLVTVAKSDKLCCHWPSGCQWMVYLGQGGSLKTFFSMLAGKGQFVS